MKTLLKLVHYSDDGHGWLAVHRLMLIELGLIDKISEYSYQSKTGITVFLEEDRDASLFIISLIKNNIQYTIESFRHGNKSRIRSMAQFNKRNML